MLYHIVLIITVLALSRNNSDFVPHNQEDLNKAHSICRAELQPPEELFAEFVQWVFPRHDLTDCYMKCLLEQLDMFNATKGFQTENIISQMIKGHPEDEERAYRAVRHCHIRFTASGDACIVAARALSCLLYANKAGIVNSFK